MKNLSRKETCWAILQQVPTYLIAVLSLLICGFLTVASLFSLAVMRMARSPFWASCRNNSCLPTVTFCTLPR